MVNYDKRTLQSFKGKDYKRYKLIGQCIFCTLMILMWLYIIKWG